MSERSLLVMPVDGTSHTVPESPISQEVDLQEAFKEHPELIPAGDLGLGSLLVVGREITVESGGSVDLLAVDSVGNVVLAEFKRGPENSDSRRVMAQVLEYASCLWGMTYEDFDELAQRYLRGQHPARLGEDVADDLETTALSTWGSQDDFSSEGFRDRLTEVLATGELSCIIISSEIDANIRRTIEFLNATARFRCYGIEVDHFADMERRVFVPRAAVVPSVKERTGGRSAPGPRTTRESFLAACNDLPRQFFTRLLDYMESTPGVVRWGRKGFTFRIQVAGGPRSVFHGLPPGTCGRDGEYAHVITSELRKAGVPEDVLSEYAAATAGLSVYSITANNNVKLDIDDKADDTNARVLISALQRLLERTSQPP